MDKLINRVYHFLLADPQKDKDYTEGNEVNGYPVYGSAAEMQERFTNAFKHRPIPSAAVPQGLTSLWHSSGCTIRYETKTDRQIPNNPLCFGYLSVVGELPKVEKVHKILTTSFPDIEKLVEDSPYR
jgi:hypothetical protein